MAGRIAGLIEPLLFTGLSTGIGLMSGQGLGEAVTEAIPGVAGAYAGQNLAERLLPAAKVNLRWKGKPLTHKGGSHAGEPLSIHYGGIGGSVLGGWAGADLGSQVYNSLYPKKPGEQEAVINPALYAADEVALPGWNVLKAVM
jgi:hypothetical protein